MKSYAELSENARDVLAEIGNIGTGNAVAALSSMLGAQIDMALPAIRLLPYRDEIGRAHV